MNTVNPSILIVDDDEYLTSAYKHALERDGYGVLTADGVDDALQKARRYRPDLIFIDRFLGSEDGLQLLDAVKADQRLAHAYCILISGKAKSSDHIIGGLHAGADGYLKKPITNKELSAHAGNYLKQREVVRKLTAAEHRLQKLITHNPDAIVVINKSGEIRFANPAAEKLFGLDKESLTGMNYGLPAVADNSAEIVVRSHSGFDVIARMNLVEEEWDGEQVFITTLRDITEQRKAEERTVDLNRLLQAVSKVNQLIIHEESKEGLFRNAADVLLEMRSYQGITIGLQEQDTTMIKPYTVAGDHYFPDNWQIDQYGEGEAPMCLKQVLKKRKSQVFRGGDFCDACPHSKKIGDSTNEVALFPMMVRRMVVGVLAVTLEEGKKMNDEEQKLLEDVSGELAFAFERFRMKQQLEHSQFKYQELFERSPVGIFQTTSGGGVKIVNTAMAHILGCSNVEEALNRFNNLKHDLYRYPERREDFIALIKEHGKVTNFEYEAVRADGKSIWLKMDAVISEEYEDGSFLIDGFASDISETKAMYQQLTENEKKFRALFESSRDAVLVANTKREIIDCNQAALDMFGFTKDDLIGKKTRNLYKDDQEFELMGTAMKENTLSQGFYQSVQYRKKSGDLFPGETNVFALHDKEGNITANVGLIRDVTRRVKAFEKLKKTVEDYQQLNEEYQAQNEEYEAQNEELNENLLHIKQMNTELAAAKRKAEENDRLKSAFLANMSHEIRTPMNAIIGFSDLLVSEVLPRDEQQKYLQVVMQKGNLLLRLIDTLIDTAKIEGQQLKLIPEQFDVNDLMDELEETNKMLLSREKYKQNIDLKVTKAFPEEHLVLDMDNGRLKQILNNLLSNAVKYTTEGVIEAGYTVSDAHISFYVSDTGAGIPESEQPYIFERFRRGEGQQDPTTKRLIGGTGIGLSIVKDLAELMGGEIRFNSTHGKGSVFFVDFPSNRKMADSILPKKTKQTDGISLTGKKIMIVEDEPHNMEYIKTLMRRTGSELILAEDGEKAVQSVRDNSDIDLVLMDIKLPGIDGYEATRQIKAINPGLKVIAQTAYAMPEDEQKARQVGCDGYISKPIQKITLFDTIKKVLV